jgi:Flp pilus assembly protein TadG
MGRKRQRGSTLVEFALVVIPAIFIVISTVELGRGMWNYHTLSRAVNDGARLASIRGAGCTTGGNTCSITVGTIATTIATSAIGLPAANFNVTLTTDSGAATACNPLNSCLSNATVWPPSTNSNNLKDKNVTVSAAYNFKSAMAIFWPGNSPVQFGAVTFGASSTQRILF